MSERLLANAQQPNEDDYVYEYKGGIGKINLI